MDLSPTAIENCQKAAIEAGAPANLTFESGNFFEYATTADFIFDYTFFCAIQPAERAAWASQMKNLARRYLLTLMFPLSGAPEVGPPFPVSFEAYSKALTPEFELLSRWKDIESDPRRAGREELVLWRHL